MTNKVYKLSSLLARVSSFQKTVLPSSR